MGSESGACGNVRFLSRYCITVKPFYYSKDVRLPVGFQRAMAAEAESSREARAKVGRTHCINILFIEAADLPIFYLKSLSLIL